MKQKVIFTVAMIICFIIVMMATPEVELGYNFPGDEGTNKLLAGLVALIASLWGSVTSRVKMVAILFVLSIVMISFFGLASMFAAGLMFIVAVVMVMKSPELKDFILTPFKDEEDV